MVVDALSLELSLARSLYPNYRRRRSPQIRVSRNLIDLATRKSEQKAAKEARIRETFVFFVSFCL
jgi:hypothetical protein